MDLKLFHKLSTNLSKDDINSGPCWQSHIVASPSRKRETSTPSRIIRMCTVHVSFVLNRMLHKNSQSIITLHHRHVVRFRIQSCSNVFSEWTLPSCGPSSMISLLLVCYNGHFIISVGKSSLPTFLHKRRSPCALLCVRIGEHSWLPRWAIASRL